MAKAVNVPCELALEALRFSPTLESLHMSSFLEADGMAEVCLRLASGLLQARFNDVPTDSEC